MKRLGWTVAKDGLAKETVKQCRPEATDDSCEFVEITAGIFRDSSGTKKIVILNEDELDGITEEDKKNIEKELEQ